MFKKLFLTFYFLLLVSSPSHASNTLEGNWKITDSLGNVRFIVNVYKTDTGSLSAKVVKNQSQVSWCVRCKGDNQNKPVKNMVILSGLIQVAGNPKLYHQGKLVDVISGNEYPIKVKVSHGNLYLTSKKNKHLTQLWTRVNY